MRNAFAQELTALAQHDENIVLLSGDIGNRLFDPFKEQNPDRFYNCGVAEANMVGVAAGMALCGLRPITYTIASFATTRCFEQIRVDLCLHNLPAIVVGVGAGLSYAGLGPTHHSCEDIAILRSLPNMTVVCPGDPLEVRLALRAALQQQGPVYLRIGKKGEPLVHDKDIEFTLGKAIEVLSGDEVCLLSTGTMLPTAIEAAMLLQQRGISAGVMSFHTVKPLDEESLRQVFDRYRLVVTVEEHTLLGGFGSAVAEWAVDSGKSVCSMLRLGTADHFFHTAGNLKDAHDHFGITAENLCARIETTLETKTADSYAHRH